MNAMVSAFRQQNIFLDGLDQGTRAIVTGFVVVACCIGFFLEVLPWSLPSILAFYAMFVFKRIRVDNNGSFISF